MADELYWACDYAGASEQFCCEEGEKAVVPMLCRVEAQLQLAQSPGPHSPIDVAAAAVSTARQAAAYTKKNRTLEPFARAKLGQALRVLSQCYADGALSLTRIPIASNSKRNENKKQKMEALSKKIAHEAVAVLRSVRLESPNFAVGAIEEELSLSLSILHPLVSIRNDHTRGRELVAACEIAPGSCIISEQPLLWWKEEEEEEKTERAAKARESGTLPIFSRAMFRSVLNFIKQQQQQAKGGNEEGEEGEHFGPLLFESLFDAPKVDVHEYLKLHELGKEFYASWLRDTINLSKENPKREKDLSLLKGLGVGELLRIALIVKINAHDALEPTETKEKEEDDVVGKKMREKGYGLFDVMSKASHSCAPNSVYDAALNQYIAARHIARGEAITFSYVGQGPRLMFSTDIRREFLRASHLFWCCCDRCATTSASPLLPAIVQRNGNDAFCRMFGPSGSVDVSRGMKCATPGCGGIRYRGFGVGPPEHPDALGDGVWICTHCAEWWWDREMPLMKEERLGQRCYELLQQFGDPSQEPVKNQFQQLKDTLQEIVGSFGQAHSTYLIITKLLSVYFLQLASGRKVKVARSTSLEASKNAMLWARKFIEGARMQRLTEVAPLVVAQECQVVTSYCAPVAELYQVGQRVVLATMATPLFQLGSAEALPFGVEKKKMLQTARRHFGNAEKTMEECVELLLDMLVVEEDESAVLGQWEDYLTDRVKRAVESSPNPDLPPEILAAMQKKKT